MKRRKHFSYILKYRNIEKKKLTFWLIGAAVSVIKKYT